MEADTRVPRHIAIIMDGNGRWANARMLPRVVGHREGVKRVKEIVRACAASGVEYLTLFALSSENWSRPRTEIQMLMRYFGQYLEKEVPQLNKNNVRLTVIGRDEPLPAGLVGKIRRAERLTQANTGLRLILAINYGSRQEIVDAARRFCDRVVRGAQKAADLNEKTFASLLYTADIPDPDLLIRTSGEIRISNFLLWQLSYTEMYFPKVMWPEFTAKELEAAIKEYRRRKRRFGNVA